MATLHHEDYLYNLEEDSLKNIMTSEILAVFFYPAY